MRLRNFVVTTIAALAFSGIAAAGPVLGFNPSISNPTQGSNFNVDIVVTGAIDLYSWQLDVAFTPSGQLNALSVAQGSFLGAGQTFGGGTIDNVNGIITLMFSTLSGPTGVSGNGVLATINFQAVGTGTVNLGLSNILLGDSFLDPIVPDPPTGAVVNIVGNANVIPEPSTYALVGLGLAALVQLRRKR